MAVTLGFVMRVDQSQAVAVPPLLPSREVMNIRPEPEVRPASVAASPAWPRPSSRHANIVRVTYDLHGNLGGKARSTGTLLDTYA